MTRVPPTPLDVLRSSWRVLRRMRTAIILLLMLGAGAGVGSLFPQRPIDPVKVAGYIQHHRGFAPWAEHLGLFDVFGSWWFMTIYGLLLVSLVGCLVPRYRAFARVLRAQPRVTRMLEQQQQYTAGTVAVRADDALSGAERVLRSRRFRFVRADDVVAGEKGNWREAGSLVFHTALLVLLVGMSIGKWFGFTGQALVVEGERFTDTRVEYDSITEGRFFSDRHRGFSLDLEKFDVAWYPNGIPEHFISRVKLTDHGRAIKDATISVNHPLTYRDVKVYQISWGWAPVIRIRQNGKTLYDGPTAFLPDGDAWHGVAKIPQSKPQQVGLDMFFYTDPEILPGGRARDRSHEPRNPIVFVQLYQGDLGLTAPQNVYTLDRTSLTPVGEVAPIPVGQSVKLANGLEVSVPALKRYSVFQLASNPGVPFLFWGALFILVGLIPSLYSSRRRVWVRAAQVNGVARLEIAGHALQRKDAFEEEFRSLVRDLDTDLATRTKT